MTDDPHASRKGLTFAQAEGAEPLPAPLALKEVSKELRAYLWNLIHSSMKQSTRYSSMGGPDYFDGYWLEVLRHKHVFLDFNMVDDFKNDAPKRMAEIRKIIEHGDYVEVFGFVQWLLSLRRPPIDPGGIRYVLEKSRSAYRLLDDDQTIVPITTVEEARALNAAIKAMSQSEYDGARAHLREAARLLNEGTPADSIRESIHAVESVARLLGGTDSLSGALQVLRTKANLHPALGKAFSSLYGFASDEKGIRHPLIEEGSPAVDETDAIFMIGACAAFISFLRGKRNSVNTTAKKTP